VGLRLVGRFVDESSDPANTVAVGVAVSFGGEKAIYPFAHLWKKLYSASKRLTSVEAANSLLVVG